MSRLDELLELQRELEAEIAAERTAVVRARRFRLHAAAVMSAAGWNLRVFNAACHHFGANPDHVLDGARDQTSIDARHVAMWLMRDAQRTYPEIGRQLGMDHSSVMNGVRRVEGNPLLLGAAREIRLELTGHAEGGAA